MALTEGLSAWLEKMTGNTLTVLKLLLGYNCTAYDPAKSDSFMNAIVSLPFVALGLFYEIHWAVAFVLNFLAGVAFVMIFKAFYCQLDRAADVSIIISDGLARQTVQVLYLSHSTP